MIKIANMNINKNITLFAMKVIVCKFLNNYCLQVSNMYLHPEPYLSIKTDFWLTTAINSQSLYRSLVKTCKSKQ